MPPLPPDLARRLAFAGALAACRAETGATATPEPGPAARAGESAADEQQPRIVADRGTAIGTRGVWVVAAWRSDVDARGIVIDFTAEKSTVADVANRVLDAGFNHARVEPATEPLAARIEIAAIIAGDKALSIRQRLEHGYPPRPTMTVLWFDDRDAGEALDILRTHPPHQVRAAIVLTHGDSPRRHRLARNPVGDLHVLEIPAHLDEPTWTEVLRFLDDVEAQLAAHAELPRRPRDAAARSIVTSAATTTRRGRTRTRSSTTARAGSQ